MKRLVLCVVLLSMVSGLWAATQYRDFTSAEGQTMRGRIRAYDARKEIVTIELENKRTKKLPITLFCEADQAYILEYGILKNFLSERFFKVSVEDDTQNSASDDSIHEIKTTATNYEILLENCAISELPKLKMEYCIYYEQEVLKGDQEVCLQGVLFEKTDIVNMAPKSEKILQTKEVLTYRKTLDSGYYYKSGAVEEQKGRVLGIWVRVYMTLSTGEKHMREYYSPSGLKNKREWSTKSVRVGNN